MQISLNWLNEYVDIKDLTPEQLAEHLTSVGLEIETIEDIKPLPDTVVTGKILTAEKHPDAEKLQVCKVDLGEDEPVQIVCGAPNARAGLHVIVAKVGSKLPGDFKIKKSKIRGVESFGMICSEEELLLGSASDGIVELADGTKLGQSIVEFLNLSDTMLTIGLTPNRADCLGYLGIARDLSAKLNRPFKKPEITGASTEIKQETESLSIDIESEEDCNRFVAATVKGVKPVDSPLWMQKRLEASGMRAKNLIVDITNYVMLEYGQPVHAYDRRDVAGDKLIVRKASHGEKLQTLDEQDRELNNGDLLICDDKKIIGLAGVMGGANSEIKDDTSEIHLEVASFDPLQIRRTSKKHALHTEASHRFERVINVDALRDVCKRIITLIEICVNELNQKGADLKAPTWSGELIDYYPTPKMPSHIAVRPSRVKKILGVQSITDEKITNTLTSLGFSKIDEANDRILFEVPLYRNDILREIDLIEEVGRLLGYDNIDYDLPVMNITPNIENPFVEFVENSRDAVSHLGFKEIISFPFVGDNDLDNLGLPKDHPYRHNTVVKNPLVDSQKYMQPSLVVNMLKAVHSNRRQGTKGVKLFEVARGFHRFSADIDTDKYKYVSNSTFNGYHLSLKAKEEKRSIERNILAGIIDSPHVLKTWNHSEKDASFFDAKSYVVNCLRSFNADNVTFETVCPEELSFLNPNASAVVLVDQRPVGYLGEIHPKCLKNFGLNIDEPVVYFELSLENTFDQTRTKRSYKATIDKFPPTTRDLAFVVDRDISHQKFTNTMLEFRRRNLNEFSIFDVYEGENIPEGKKSMAFSFSFKSQKKTLTDKEVDKEIDLIKSHLETNLNATLR